MNSKGVFTVAFLQSFAITIILFTVCYIVFQCLHKVWIYMTFFTKLYKREKKPIPFIFKNKCKGETNLSILKELRYFFGLYCRHLTYELIIFEFCRDARTTYSVQCSVMSNSKWAKNREVIWSCLSLSANCTVPQIHDIIICFISFFQIFKVSVTPRIWGY